MSVTDQLSIARNASQSLTGAVGYTVAFDTETTDTGGYWAPGAPTKIIVPTGKTGYHFFTFAWGLSAGFGGARAFTDLAIYNALDVPIRYYRGMLGRDDSDSTITIMTKLNAGEYMICNVWVDSAMTLAAVKLEMVRFD